MPPGRRRSHHYKKQNTSTETSTSNANSTASASASATTQIDENDSTIVGKLTGLINILNADSKDKDLDNETILKLRHNILVLRRKIINECINRYNSKSDNLKKIDILKILNTSSSLKTENESDSTEIKNENGNKIVIKKEKIDDDLIKTSESNSDKLSDINDQRDAIESADIDNSQFDKDTLKQKNSEISKSDNAKNAEEIGKDKGTDKETGTNENFKDNIEDNINNNDNDISNNEEEAETNTKKETTNGSHDDNNDDDDDDDDDDEPPRKKLKLTLHIDDDNEDNKNDSKISNYDNEIIPSVYSKNNGHAMDDIDTEKLSKSIFKSLELYDDNYNKKISKNEIEFKKRKYAVSEFPKSDLKDRLPGEIPNIDFSIKNKPNQQIAWNSFCSYIDPFFRNFNEDDIKWLNNKFISSNLLSKYLLDNNKNKDHNPFLIPKLGNYYKDIWNLENEGKSIKLNKLSNQLSNKLKKISNPKGSLKDMNFISNGELFENNFDKVSCGPLTSRILSAIVSDDLSDSEDKGKNGIVSEYESGNENKSENENENENENEDEDLFKEEEEGDGMLNTIKEEEGEGEGDSLETENVKSNVKENENINDTKFMTFEQVEKRLNKELKYIGIFMNVAQTLNCDEEEFEQDWSLGKEDDEICFELRKLQKNLKNVQEINNQRKEILLPLIEEQIAWQEYIMIVEDLDKQVEQHYRRRMVTPKRGKKTNNVNTNGNVNGINSANESSLIKDDTAHLVSNASFRGLLEKRKRWIEKIGCLFKSNWEVRRMPVDSIFEKKKTIEEEGGGKEGEGSEGHEESEEEQEAEEEEEEEVKEVKEAGTNEDEKSKKSGDGDDDDDEEGKGSDKNDGSGDFEKVKQEKVDGEEGGDDEEEEEEEDDDDEEEDDDDDEDEEDDEEEEEEEEEEEPEEEEEEEDEQEDEEEEDEEDEEMGDISEL